jgi:hypothetical protein
MQKMVHEIRALAKSEYNPPEEKPEKKSVAERVYGKVLLRESCDEPETKG